MNLSAFVSVERQRLLERLSAGEPPDSGEWDPDVLRAAFQKGQPQVGAVRFEPETIRFEFVYAEPQGVALILSVAVPSPERIVFMPVPEWVVENVWQGEVDGSYRFESEALALVEAYKLKLTAAANRECFVPRKPIGRN